MFYFTRYTSFIIAIACIAVSLFGFIDPKFIQLFGLHYNFYNDDLFSIVSQISLFQFLHSGVIHLMLNCYFLYSIGPMVEARMKKNEFLYFFLFSSIVVIGFLTFFSNGTTIGMSGFCMALVSYLWLDLKGVNNPAAQQMGILVVLNIAI